MAKHRSSRQRKIAQGTLRLDRLGKSTVPPLKRLPKAPEALTEAAKEAWEQFGRLAIELGTLSTYDTGLLELLARTWASCVELERLLTQDGLVLVSGAVRKAHPGLQALDRARALAHRLLADLGLTPPARERITIDPGTRARKPWDFDPTEKYF